MLETFSFCVTFFATNFHFCINSHGTVCYDFCVVVVFISSHYYFTAYEINPLPLFHVTTSVWIHFMFWVNNNHCTLTPGERPRHHFKVKGSECSFQSSTLTTQNLF